MVISKDDFDKLNDRIRHYMDWSFYNIQYLTLKELHEAFLESFLNTAKLNKDKKVDFLDDVFENDNPECQETQSVLETDNEDNNAHSVRNLISKN